MRLFMERHVLHTSTASYHHVSSGFVHFHPSSQAVATAASSGGSSPSLGWATSLRVLQPQDVARRRCAATTSGYAQQFTKLPFYAEDAETRDDNRRRLLARSNGSREGYCTQQHFTPDASDALCLRGVVSREPPSPPLDILYRDDHIA